MIIGSFALLFMAGGAAMWFNDADIGRYGMVFSFAVLVFMLFPLFADHFKPEHQFAFEVVAWYWHFVDVVWLLLSQYLLHSRVDLRACAPGSLRVEPWSDYSRSVNKLGASEQPMIGAAALPTDPYR